MRTLLTFTRSLFLFLLAALAACQDERADLSADGISTGTPFAPTNIGDYTFADNEIRFGITVDNLNGPSTRSIIGGDKEVDAVSGATVGLTSPGNVENISGYTAFEDGDEIGIFVVERTDPSTRTYPSDRENYAHNVKWRYYADPDLTKSGFIPAGTTDDERQLNRILYPGNDVKVDIYAYYPYRETKDFTFDDDNRFTFTAKANQRWNAIDMADRQDLRKSTFMQSDLLWADSGEEGKLNGAVTLRFTHALALVELTLTADNPHLTNIDKIMEVQILDAKTELHYGGTREPSTGGEPKKIKMRLVQQKENIPCKLDTYITRVYRALIPAQTFSEGDELFYISMGNTAYTYRAKGEVTFKAGTKNTYSMILNDRDPNELFYNRKDKNPNGFNVKFNKNQSGKSTDLLTAAPWVDGEKGVCYIYSYAGINWIKAGDLRTNIDDDCLSFGSSIDVGRSYIIVGAPTNNNKTGNVYLFQYEEGNWPLKGNKSGNTNEEFGTSVAVAEVGNVTKFIASAPGVWNQKYWLKMSLSTDIDTWTTPLEAATNPRYTERILASETKLVTQHLDDKVVIHDIEYDNIKVTDVNTTDPIVALHSIFLFCRSANDIKIIDIENPEDQPETLTANSTDDEFGLSASITGNGKKGYAVIGAPGTDNNKGAVHIWEYHKYTWSYLGKIQPTSLKEGTRFGTSVAIIETTSNVGVTEVTIAVSGMNNVYVFNDITKFVTPTP